MKNDRIKLALVFCIALLISTLITIFIEILIPDDIKVIQSYNVFRTIGYLFINVITIIISFIIYTKRNKN